MIYLTHVTYMTMRVVSWQAVTKVTHNCKSRESTGAKIQRKLDCSSSLNAGIIKQQNESTYLSCLKSRSRLTITSGTDWWSGGGARTQKRFCILSHSGHEFTG